MVTNTTMATATTVAGRIRALMMQLGVTQREFAERISLDTSNLSKYLNGHIAISDALLNRIAVNLGVNKQWLLTGEGLPFAAGTRVLTASMPGIAIADAAVADGRGTPVYDIDVTAGGMPRATLFASDRISGWIDMPSLMDPGSKVVSVSGNSMAPVINAGDLIAVREVPNMDLILWGEIYVVLLDDYRMVKYVRRHPDRTMVTLHSENAAYDDIELPRRDIRELMIVQSILHIDRRL